MSDDRLGPFPDERNEADSVPGARSGSEDRDALEDLKLGKAVGRALRERPGTAWATPPVSLITERAAARARARAARRTAAGVVAAALIIGGVAVWKGLDGDGTGTIVVSADDPGSANPDAAGLDNAAADGAGTSAAAPAEADGPATGGAADDPSASSDPPTVEADQPALPDKPTPEELSTGPVLQWTEIDPGFADLYRLESVGDGRVVARAWRGAGPGANSETVGQVVVTTNGADWAEVPMPAGIVPHFVDISSDRWVATGQGGDADARGEAGPVPASLGRAFFSDDEGATWTELALNLPPDPARASPYVVEDSRVASVLVSGSNIVLVVARDTGLDLSALLEGRDLVPEGRTAVGWSTTRRQSIVFDLVDSAQLGGAGPARLIAYGTGGGGVGGGAWGPPVASISLTYAELGLTDEERAVLDGTDYGRVLLLAGDGSAMEAVAEYGGWPAAAFVTAEGFVVRVIGPEGAAVASPDGRLWSELPSSEPWLTAGAVVAGGTIWDVAADQPGTLAIRRGRFGEAVVPLATFEGLQSAGRLAAGPAGVVVTAHPAPAGARSKALDSVLPEGRIAKDGYELRYNEPEGGVTLWDLEAGAAVHVFGPEDRQGDQPPAGVRESSDGGEFALVFEDPETGADLVTFTYEDLAPVFEAAPDTEGATLSDDPGDFEAPETWAGWSADGSAWGWQTTARAFGIDNASVWAEFAVGGDYVIARVVAATDEEVRTGANTRGDGAFVSLQPGERLIRWFIARVP